MKILLIVITLIASVSSVEASFWKKDQERASIPHLYSFELSQYEKRIASEEKEARNSTPEERTYMWKRLEELEGFKKLKIRNLKKRISEAFHVRKENLLRTSLSMLERSLLSIRITKYALHKVRKGLGEDIVYVKSQSTTKTTRRF
jgi:hypothetical protein